MVVVWGTRLYGKTDAVKGLFYVATSFFYLQFIPLVPLGSYAVVNETAEGGWEGASVGLSLKSLFLAWARIGIIIGALICLAIGFIALDAPNGMAVMWFVSAGGLVVLRVMTEYIGWCTTASYERAHALGEKIGLNEQGKILLDLAYGIITEEEANAALEGLAAEAEAATESEAALEDADRDAGNPLAALAPERR